MVRASPAVIIGWRVLWLVAAVTTVSCSLTAPAAPDRTPISFLSNRSDRKTEPRPSASPVRTSSTRSRELSGWPASP